VIHRTGKYRAEERYSADRGPAVYNECMCSRDRKPVISAELAGYLHLPMGVHRQSPEAVSERMKKERDKHAGCFKTSTALSIKGG